MCVSDVINVVAIILAPIASVIIGQILQDRAKKRQDKMQIFTTLMTYRVHGWSYQSVYALNIIDVVFSDDSAVREQWKKYYEKLCIEKPTKSDLKKIETEENKLLEVIANSLGYKDKITWETIQNPYMPRGMFKSIQQQEQYQNNQAQVMEFLKNNMQKDSGGNDNEQNEI